MRRIILAIFALPAFVGAGSAQAMDIANHDYLAARYALRGKADYGNPHGDVTGLGLEASRALGDQVFLRLNSDLYDVDLDGPGSRTALDRFTVGPGIGIPLNTRMPVELWGELDYARLSVGGTAADGFGAHVGLRAQFAERFSGGVTLQTANTDAGRRDFDYEAYTLDLAYQINPRVDLTVSLVNGTIKRNGNASDIDLDNVLQLGVRLPF